MEFLLLSLLEVENMDKDILDNDNIRLEDIDIFANALITVGESLQKRDTEEIEIINDSLLNFYKDENNVNLSYNLLKLVSKYKDNLGGVK